MYSPAGQSADKSRMARANDRSGQHSERRVLETLVQQRLCHPRGLPMQEGPDRLGGEVPQPEASAPGSQHQVHGLRLLCMCLLSVLYAVCAGVAPMTYHLLNGL